jgi:hypothetical protein
MQVRFIAYSLDTEKNQSKSIPKDKTGTCQRSGFRFHTPPNPSANPPNES